MADFTNIHSSDRNPKRGWQFWIDRGGTFTDIVAKNPSNRLITHKLLSENPEHYQDAAVQGIRDLMQVPNHCAVPTDMIKSIKMGTTVATNALLERKGAPCVLAITKGFGDLLDIGYQNRPRLFDLNVTKPAPYYHAVVEIDERLGADGAVITPLDNNAIKSQLTSVYESGVRAIAVALMHSYRYPAHEMAIGGIAAEIGFTQISLSHQASPLVKLVARGDTCLVDAYLSPVLRKYVSQVNASITGSGGKFSGLMFMQSNGGLTDANRFQGKDAILSGPAGGVVGMIKTAAQLGQHRLIGFDMGGTSTDVCHYAGEMERTVDSEVAGVRVRAPMMSIHTIAAGGGSIVSVRDGRLQVGPASAGADPGPACYRKGGPPTVTDCNVLLGKIQPDLFPSVFGPDASQPLDTLAAKQEFAKLYQVLKQGSPDMLMSIKDEYEMAAGFLRIAVENMANAIKKISVQRGYDVTQYTLDCFGGAGGQHACLVADVLGIQRVLIHAHAGVLSAYGMGLADVHANRQRQIDLPIRQSDKSRKALDTITKAAVKEVMEQGFSSKDVKTKQTANLRYAGSHQTLGVPFGSASDMELAFTARHKSQFGFVMSQREIILDWIEAEAIGQAGDIVVGQQNFTAHGSESPEPRGTREVYFNGGWHRAGIFTRDLLKVGQIVCGPAIIIEATGTNVVEPGWTANLCSDGHLLLERAHKLERRESIGAKADPIMLEVFNNLFMNIAEQMGATLANTAYSVNIKERLDFSCAIFDADGDLVANAPHVPVHLGSMSDCVRTMLAENHEKIMPGDVFVMNNPYFGGTHLPDVTVLTPMLDEDGKSLRFVVASRGHHADIGGKTPGSAPPDSTNINEEGVVIDNFKIISQGMLQLEEARKILGSGRFPCRNIDQNIADLTAQIAANETGVAGLRNMVAQFGQSTVSAYMKHVQDNAEESVRCVIDRLKDSQFTYHMDRGRRISVAIKVDARSRSARIDFSGTSPQDSKNYNAPSAVCRAAVMYVFRTLVGEDIPLNEGCLKPLSLIMPEGTIINPRYPAAVIAGNTEISQSIAETLYGALGVIACSQGTMNNFVWGNDRVQNYETICGGGGAGPNFPGASAIQTHMTNTRATDPEVLENRFPVRVETFSIRSGSGGDGRQRGGEGICRTLRFLEPMTVTTLSSHREVRPFGQAGGKAGAVGENWLEKQDGTRTRMKGDDQCEVGAGDAFTILTPGGGGYGTQ